ncbi:hypothetical protein CRP01_32235 [Flavilitoribacter nigricans DSM 23189 = NBRC 102662]|uniref:Uncharacterized protein n=1 Tax=Flavilitoribacter nigricans (strain ATCC 23147 / DSM 23189 / NBRC 102662 / NCIMB 1420 / SS-2) TaxID=1122177 RepID=A0A2D0N1N3_FLAN2|nr:hypothetical protein CRP01_32235 [Flavilitoribacter nigricans DSM 23189 = NBRC 102662]
MKINIFIEATYYVASRPGSTKEYFEDLPSVSPQKTIMEINVRYGDIVTIIRPASAPSGSEKALLIPPYKNRH